MGMPPNLYLVKAQDINKDDIIWTDDDTNGLGITKFRVISNPTTKNNILFLQCVNLDLGVDQVIKVNLSQQREIFMSKVQSNWRKV